MTCTMLNIAVRAVRSQEEVVRELKTASARDVVLAPASVNLNIMDLVLNQNLYAVAPAIFPWSFWFQAGGAASYGPDLYAESVQWARAVGGEDTAGSTSGGPARRKDR